MTRPVRLADLRWLSADVSRRSESKHRGHPIVGGRDDFCVGGYAQWQCHRV